MPCGERAVRAAVAAIDRYLAGIDGSGAALVRDCIAALTDATPNGLAPRVVPVCELLDEALRCVDDSCDLARAFAEVRSCLHWTTYDEYPREDVGPRFPEAHAFASLVGPTGLLRSRDFELGLFLMAPNVLYRDHHHAAPELYVPLTGPHRWRFGTEAAWEDRPAHNPVWNDPWAIHAIITGTRPFLSIFSWTRDVDLPARLVHADDWPEIEERLERRAL
jgi:hypothetical protein